MLSFKLSKRARNLRGVKCLTAHVVQAANLASVSSSKQRVGVYIHWPYCRRKCNYCNFNKYVSDEENVITQCTNKFSITWTFFEPQHINIYAS